MRIDGPQITGSFSLNGEGVQDLDVFATTSSLNTFTSSVDTTMGHVMTATHSLNTFTSSADSRMISIESKTGSYATTGSNIFIGTQTISGSIIPSVDNTYDLGSTTHQFRDLYLSSASLYIDGTKVLSSTTQELQITTDNGQSFKILEAGSDTITLQSNDGNITFATSGGGDVILDPTTGIIALKGTTTLYAGNKILSSDGNAIQIGNSVTMTGSLIVTGFIEAQELRTTYISSSILYRSGSTKFGDELTDTHAFTGSLLVSGSINVPGSGLVSGSAQILNGSGVWSGSAQLPSGVVSGSVQVDVMSTTNIARLATTGSNTFTGALSGTTATFSSSVTSTNLYLGSLTNEQLMISGNGSRGIGISTTTSGDPFVRLYDNTTIKGDVWWSRSGNYMGINSISNINTAINPNGGNILLGTPTEYGSGFRLQVNGSAYITGIVYSNAGFYINSGQYTGITEAPYTGMYMTNSSSSDGFGALLVTSRTDVARPIIFGTSNGSVSVERLRITPAGVLSGTTAAFSSAVTVGGHNVWTAGNDGSGSGLDADLLDGRDSGGYMTQVQGGIEFPQGSYTGWYKIARSSEAVNGAGGRGSFKIIVAATGNYLTPSQDEITGFKDWTTNAIISSIASTPDSIFQDYRITYDTNYSYLEGYISYYFGGSQSIVINSYVNGLNGLTWSPYTGTAQASSTSSGAVSIGKVNNGFTVPYLRSAAGIKFGSGSGTLNYYEEGTFTPSSVGTDFSSISVVHGKYVRVGNQVTVNCKWTVTPGGTGRKYIVFNLPFAFVATSSNGFTGAVSNYNEGFSTYSSNVGTTVRNSSSSDTQQYVEAVYTSANANSSLQLMMTYFTF